jgi:hypothetical protein
MNTSYIKHLIECVCYLPQFENHNPIIFHKFPVFSEIDENNKFIEHFAKCNYCGMVHKIIEVGISKTLNKENIAGIETKEDILASLPPKYQNILDTYKNIELTTLQEIKFIIENQQWGKFVFLEKEELDQNTIIGKKMMLISEQLFKIDKFIFEKEK